MISYQCFKEQLISIFNDKKYQLNSFNKKIQSINLIKNDLNDIYIKITTSIFQQNTNNDLNLIVDIPDSSCYLDIIIKYSHIYKNPILLFQIWKIENNNSILSPYISNNIKSINNNFTISLDNFSFNNQSISDIFYFIHPCDTDDIIGGNGDLDNNYLLRWFNVYLNVILF